MITRREWAMPSKNTFEIKPIKELLETYMRSGMVIVDPFANKSKLGTITNDLNPEYDTTYHLDALEFLRLLPSNSADMVLFDPPYSITQAKICYDSFGSKHLKNPTASAGYWSDCKDEVARILKSHGIVICCGWNSMGIGKNRGFDMLEYLSVAHGGMHNDTLVTVERKNPRWKRFKDSQFGTCPVCGHPLVWESDCDYNGYDNTFYQCPNCGSSVEVSRCKVEEQDKYDYYQKK